MENSSFLDLEFFMFGVVGRSSVATRRYCATRCVQYLIPVVGLLRDISICCLGVLRARSQGDDGDVFRGLRHFARYIDNYGNAAFGWNLECFWYVFAFFYQRAHVPTTRDRAVFFAGGEAACCFGVGLRLAGRLASSDRLLGVFLAGMYAV